MQNKKYYICVTPFFPSPNNWRGSYVLDQVKAIKRNSDYEVVVFIGVKDPSDYEIEGIKVYQYRSRETPSNVLNGIFNNYNAESFVRRVLDVGIDPKDVAFVHCHVSMRAACGLALKNLNPNIKVLIQHHDLDPFNLRSGVIGRYNWFNVRYKVFKALKLYNQADLHVCISEACRDSLLAFPNARKGEIYEDYLRVIAKANGMKHVTPKALYVLYNGVDTHVFKKKHTDIARANKFRIGCIGNFWDLKGQMTLIKAFDIFIHHLSSNVRNDIKLSLLGTGETRKQCEQYINEHGLAQYVEWPKEVFHDKLPEYYHSLDLFVLPSYFEGFGCVFTEAAACGVPFMGCVNQGYSEYVKDKDLWLITPNDYEQLASLIEHQYQERNEQTLRYSFDIDDLINDFLKYIQNL